MGVAFFAVLFVLSDDGTYGAYGLVQRLGLAAGGIWVGSLTIGLLAIYGRDRDPAVRLVEWIRRLPYGGLVVLPRSGLEE